MGMIRRSLGIFTAATLVAAVAGCSSRNVCEKACRKIARCAGETGAAPECPFSAACSLKEECKAKCINDAGCDAILGEDPSLQGCMAGCDNLPVNGDGSADVGVTVDTGGIHDLAPQIDIFLPADTSVNQDVFKPADIYVISDTMPTTTVGKFCNAVGFNAGDDAGTVNDVVLTLKLGSGTSQVTWSANTNECSVPVGFPCQTMPAGSNIKVQLLQDTNILIDSTIPTIDGTKEYIWLMTVNQQGQAELQPANPNPGYTCQDIDPFQ